MKSFFAVYKLLETPLQNNSTVVPMLMAGSLRQKWRCAPQVWMEATSLIIR